MTLASLRDIELVRALAEHRHFGRAAMALGISQPAVSRALAQIEAEVGELLFERSTMLPSHFGKVVLRHADSVVGGFADIAREIALLRGLEVGELAVAMGPYPAAISGQGAAAELSRRHPRISMDLRVMNWGSAMEAVLGRQVDLAFADLREAKHNPELQVQPVRQGPLTFFSRAGHPLALRTDITLIDCLDYPWVGPLIPGPIDRPLPSENGPFGSFDPVRHRLKPRIMAETFQAMREIIMASDAIGAALPFMIRAETQAGDLAPLLEVPALALNYGFIWRKGRELSPAAKAFMAIALECEAKHPQA